MDTGNSASLVETGMGDILLVDLAWYRWYRVSSFFCWTWSWTSSLKSVTKISIGRRSVRQISEFRRWPSSERLVQAAGTFGPLQLVLLLLHVLPDPEPSTLYPFCSSLFRKSQIGPTDIAKPEVFRRVRKVEGKGKWEELDKFKCLEAKCREKPWKVRARTYGTKSPSRSEALRFIDSAKFFGIWLSR